MVQLALVRPGLDVLVAADHREAGMGSDRVLRRFPLDLQRLQPLLLLLCWPGADSDADCSSPRFDTLEFPGVEREGGLHRAWPDLHWLLQSQGEQMDP